jgi:hypothetical protein
MAATPDYINPDKRFLIRSAYNFGKADFIERAKLYEENQWPRSAYRYILRYESPEHGIFSLYEHMPSDSYGRVDLVAHMKNWELYYLFYNLTSEEDRADLLSRMGTIEISTLYKYLDDEKDRQCMCQHLNPQDLAFLLPYLDTPAQKDLVTRANDMLDRDQFAEFYHTIEPEFPELKCMALSISDRDYILNWEV